MGNTFGLTNERFIELRLKCLEPFITIASKTQIEQDIVVKRAEFAWNEFVVKPLVEQQAQTHQEIDPAPQVQQAKAANKARQK